ncbi:ubiquitin-protein ligase E3A-like [Diadema setosum]|uniref:ubiquitin-protein ligase E3A-like n=1 Tax=Diadema setosum TaxID=31175 RepID=UPI003B3B55C3
MNSTKQDSKASPPREEALEEEAVQESNSGEDGDSSDEMKRSVARGLIERYFYQLVNGCGNASCCNEFCASSGRRQNLSSNEAAAMALDLFKRKATLCDSAPPKQQKTGKDEDDGMEMQGVEPSTSKSSSVSTPSTSSPSSMTTSTSSKSHRNSSISESIKDLSSLSEVKVSELIQICKESENYSPLVRVIGQVFSCWQSLNNSFLRIETEGLSEKERRQEFEGEKEADETEEGLQGISTRLADHDLGECSSETIRKKEVDIGAVQRVYDAIFKLDQENVNNAMLNAVTSLAQNADVEVRYNAHFRDSIHHLNFVLITMENPMMSSPEYLEVAFPTFCRALSHLPLPACSNLTKTWAKFPADNLMRKLQALQQLITFKVLSGHFNAGPRRITVNEDDAITSATDCMKMLYYASILGGEVEVGSRLSREEEELSLQEFLGAIGHENKERKPPKEDPFSKELRVSVMDCRKPLIPFNEFYNEPLNDQLEVDHDFTCYKKESDGRFSFLNYPFILTPATKNMGLYYDNRVRMFHERRLTLLNSLVQGEELNPYLKLKVRRDHVVDDALVRLEMIAMDNPLDLKKQLYVEFEGEQGVDEGGVSKEFFQLVIEEIFNPDIGMFTMNTELQTYWFNPMSFETDRQYTLIGIVLGLAIYNNIILDVHFPMVVYRKLMGRRGVLADLHDAQPVLYSSLKALLDHEGNTEEAFMMNFLISYTDVFGNTITHDLKENGADIPVTTENRQEFVDLYANFILNKSIERQFRAFRRGFDMVTDESPLKTWFRPDEVELLVCGSKNFDFDELEKATEYDGGYTSSSPIIKYFWEIVHNMDDDQKKKLLMFTTGSDRVPVGGLSKLRLIIAKNGPDSDRLPTSHTCFNVLLLPEYSSKAKLEERLLKAITHAKGFGML